MSDIRHCNRSPLPSLLGFQMKRLLLDLLGAIVLVGMAVLVLCWPWVVVS